MSSLRDLLGRYLPTNALRIGAQRKRGVKIGDHVFLGYDVHIDATYPELVELEDHVRIGIGVIILAHARPGDAWMDHLGETRARVRIERHAAVYSGALVGPGVTIGAGAIVREGAVVLEDVPSCAVVMGNPARVVDRLPRDKARGLGPPP
jgi:acetyltransferase-like isoleucine patch superfamily enzyme